MPEYDTSLIKRKPEESQEYQLAEQKYRAKSSGDRAIYSDVGLRDQFINKQMSKTLRLQEMGLRKKQVEGGQALQREELEHRKTTDLGRLSLANKAIDYSRKQDKIGSWLAVGNMALSAGMGWLQWKEQQENKEILKNTRALWETSLSKRFGVGMAEEND